MKPTPARPTAKPQMKRTPTTAKVPKPVIAAIAKKLWHHPDERREGRDTVRCVLEHYIHIRRRTRLAARRKGRKAT